MTAGGAGPSDTSIWLRAGFARIVMYLIVAEVLVGVATDATVFLSRWGEALEVNELTFTIRASDSSWHPGLPGRPRMVKVNLLTLSASSAFSRRPSDTSIWMRAGLARIAMYLCWCEGTREVGSQGSRFYLTTCKYQSVFKSQVPHKIVN